MAKIRKIGNSIGLSISRIYVNEFKLKVGDQIPEKVIRNMLSKKRKK